MIDRKRRDYPSEWDEIMATLNAAVRDGKSVKVEAFIEETRKRVEALNTSRIFMMPPNKNTDRDYKVDRIQFDHGLNGTIFIALEQEDPDHSLADITLTKEDAKYLIEQLRAFL